MQTVTLNNGVEMPILGFGVFQIPPEETEQAVTDALAAGYRLLDTAAAYGNEEAVGRAIKASGIPREELFVTTKLWVQDAAEDNTKRAFETSLNKLGLDHLDLYLMHQPFGDVYGQWRAMEPSPRGPRQGDRRRQLLPRPPPRPHRQQRDHPAVNQIETHPFFQRTDDQDLMREHGVQIQSWGRSPKGKNDLFTNPLLSEIGKKHGKSVAQVVLRWLTQRGVVAIPKSVRAERMAENIDVFDFELTDEQMDLPAIATLDTGGSLACSSTTATRDGHLARAGHRLRLHLHSSDFPEFVLRPGTDENPWLATRGERTTQRIRLGGADGARLVLTVASADASPSRTSAV
jgi:2,5-diketo-D-gluconate reductase A